VWPFYTPILSLHKWVSANIGHHICIFEGTIVSLNEL
jgi:hypothetical protein